MTVIEQKVKRHPSDLTDKEWTRIAPLLSAPAQNGRKLGVDMRVAPNAICYMARSGGGGRM